MRPGSPARASPPAFRNGPSAGQSGWLGWLSGLTLPRARPAPPRPRLPAPGELGLRPGAGLPAGTTVELDPGTQQLTGDVLFGGSPARVVRLSAAGRAALAELRTGAVASPAGSALAGRLADTGLAHPRPARPGRHST